MGNETTIRKNGKYFEVDNATIKFKNFSGRGGKSNHEGDRSFVWTFDDEDIYNDLLEWGFSPKWKEWIDRTGAEHGEYQLSVKVKYRDGRGPEVHLWSGDDHSLLDEDSIGDLDDMVILRFDFDIRPYDWEVNGATGRKAYLDRCSVETRPNRFARRRED